MAIHQSRVRAHRPHRSAASMTGGSATRRSRHVFVRIPALQSGTSPTLGRGVGCARARYGPSRTDRLTRWFEAEIHTPRGRTPRYRGCGTPPDELPELID